MKVSKFAQSYYIFKYKQNMRSAVSSKWEV